MNKEFIPYEQALELKELGFNEECLATYIKHPNKDVRFDIQEQSGICWHTVKNTDFETGEHCSIPLYQQAFRWFREKYDFYTEIFVDDDKTFGFLISSFIENGELARIDKPIKRQFATYEEAELECLKWLIDARQRKPEAYS